MIDLSKNLPIIYYENEHGHVAHCLTTDLKGYGNDFNKAYKELMGMIIMQASFANKKDEPELFYVNDSKEKIIKTIIRIVKDLTKEREFIKDE